MDWIWTLAACLLTLMIFSYLLGDNPLFRLAVYLFVGTAAGYVTVIIIYQVLLPRLIWPLIYGRLEERLFVLFPLVLSALLLGKLSPRLGILGNIPLGYLTGVGAAVVIGGAVMGTLFGQSRAAAQAFDLSGSGSPILRTIGGLILLTGTISTLVYFQFGARSRAGQPPSRPKLVEGIARIGRFFIAITLGALFAGVLSAALSALIDRLSFLVDVITRLITRTPL